MSGGHVSDNCDDEVPDVIEVAHNFVDLVEVQVAAVEDRINDILAIGNHVGNVDCFDRFL